MKNTLTCPKCSSRKIWRIDKAGEGGFVLAHSRRKMPETQRKSFWDDEGVYHGGPVDAYACGSCGYTEFWAHDLDKLVHNPECGVHFIDTTPQRGEYR